MSAPLNQQQGPPVALLPHHWAELQASAIALDVAAANVSSFGPGTDRHWELERAELVRHARHRIQTDSTTGRGHSQGQAGFLADRLIRLDQRYRHLQAGGWRSCSDALPGVAGFDQWKPDQARPRADKPGRSIKYEAPPAFPDGGGLLLPRVPDRCWQLICDRQGLALPDAATRAEGFWPWAVATPGLQLLICEGFKKALAAVGAGWAAVALPGVQMGRRTGGPEGERLIEALDLLARRARPWLIAFDAEAQPTTAAKVGAAAGALARSLRAAGGRVAIARLPLLPGTTKTGLDDLLAASGPEALDQALANTGHRPILPRLRPADRIAPAGQWLGVACPLPSPTECLLLVIRAAMGCGKTLAVAEALAPLQAEGVPVLMPSHRQALGQAAAAAVGVPWCPAPGSDERQQGVAGCLDSWCPGSALRISGDGWSGGVMVLDELMQQLEHLLLSHGTALGGARRAAAMRTLAEQLPRLRQLIAMDAQLADWGVVLLERLTGQRAWLVASDHQPMAGRALHCPEGFETPQAAAEAFRVQWAELVDDGRPFFCWTSAQKAKSRNSPQNLAALHRKRNPGARIQVIDSTTPELAAELAADPDGVAERWGATIYASPSISSGISWQRWRPAAVIALAGGRIAPEHAIQAAARVRCPEVPAYLFAPEQAPGGALRVGSGATNPADLIAHLQAAGDPLLGHLQAAGSDGAWLDAWAALGALRNRQRSNYRATMAGLLQAEGWELQAQGPAPCKATAETITNELTAVATAAMEAARDELLAAPIITTAEAADLRKEKRRRKLEPSERAALDRHDLASRWALGDRPLAPLQLGGLLKADEDGLRDRLRLGWMLTTPEALRLVRHHDQQQIAALDPAGCPFAPDRLRVALAPKVWRLARLRLPQLLERLKTGAIITAADPDVVALHGAAVADQRLMVAAAGCSPGVKATGTLRALLRAVGWQLVQHGRIKARGEGRDQYLYTAEPVPVPLGVDADALAAAWLAELQATTDPGAGGAFFAPEEKNNRGGKSPRVKTATEWAAEREATPRQGPHGRSSPPPPPPRHGWQQSPSQHRATPSPGRGRPQGFQAAGPRLLIA